MTSAISSVKAEDFTVGKVGDAADLIKGKVAGLTIAKGSGDPNATSTIRLRGVISVNGSTTPLILIDGVEGDLGTVAPENIEAIDVLKDASAAAIYGTRGANGVILITTKPVSVKHILLLLIRATFQLLSLVKTGIYDGRRCTCWKDKLYG